MIGSKVRCQGHVPVVGRLGAQSDAQCINLQDVQAQGGEAGTLEG